MGIGDDVTPTFSRYDSRSPIVDAHVHVGLDKYRSMEQFEGDAQAHAVDRAILVQYMGNFDNTYLSSCVRRAPDRYVGIAIVDVSQPEAEADIDRVASEGTFAGIRLEARTRSKGGDPYRLWRSIADAGLVASVRGPLEDILDSSFTDLLDELPQLPVRLEHGAFFRFGEHTSTHLDALLALSDRPRTYLMWSGYYDFSRLEYPHLDSHAFLRATLGAFGAGKIMWSGDWNRNDLDPGRPSNYFEQALHYVENQLSFVQQRDIPQIMGTTSLGFIAESTCLAEGPNDE